MRSIKRLTMFELQRFLLEKQPTRRELLEYTSHGLNEVKICVYRNHSFELVEHTIGAYLDFSNIKASFVYSDYDDSLSFLNIDRTADLLILWLDLGRYKIDNIEAFVNERISVLKTVFEKPVIFVAVNGNLRIKDKQIVCVDLSKIEAELGQRFWDERMEFATGTKLSAQALVRISKELGLRFIPALICPSLKAIVIDLDNTLYKGVLGEEGINGIELTEGHKQLQETLKRKAEEGFFLCVASKNDKQDVLDMFDKRKDFPLKKEMFTTIEASWDDKSISMSKILKTLNIGVDSVLFIDDNLGEQAQMLASFPTIKELHALDDGEVTTKVLEYYPGLLKLSTKIEDTIRSGDVKANLERQKLQETLSKNDYIKSLKMKLILNIDMREYISRISELANKTNQFIFNYKRYDVSMVENLMNDDDTVVVSAMLSDKLSDSGTIGVCVCKRDNDVLILDECFVSCRALGRGIDDIIVLGMIKLAANTLGLNKLKVCFKKGERNFPAEKFVDMYLKKYINKESPIDFSFDDSLIEIQIVKG